MVHPPSSRGSCQPGLPANASYHFTTQLSCGFCLLSKSLPVRHAPSAAYIPSRRTIPLGILAAPYRSILAFASPASPGPLSPFDCPGATCHRRPCCRLCQYVPVIPGSMFHLRLFRANPKLFSLLDSWAVSIGARPPLTNYHI